MPPAAGALAVTAFVPITNPNPTNKQLANGQNKLHECLHNVDAKVGAVEGKVDVLTGKVDVLVAAIGARVVSEHADGSPKVVKSRLVKFSWKFWAGAIASIFASVGGAIALYQVTVPPIAHFFVELNARILGYH